MDEDPEATHPGQWGLVSIVTIWTTRMSFYNMQLTLSPLEDNNITSPFHLQSSVLRLVSTQDALASGGTPMGITMVVFTTYLRH